MTYRKNQRDFTEFLQDILDAIDDVEGFIKGMEFNEFSGDKKTIYAAIFNVVGLGYYLEDLFGVPVDVVSEMALHPMMGMTC